MAALRACGLLRARTASRHQASHMRGVAIFLGSAALAAHAQERRHARLRSLNAGLKLGAAERGHVLAAAAAGGGRGNP